MEEKLREREIDNEFMEELLKENPSYDKLTELLKARADINSLYYIYDTNCIMQLIGLCHAYFKDDYNKAKKLVEFLIDNGANINHLASIGWSIIHCCVEVENIELLKYFLDKGVSPNYVDMWRGTPLDELESSVLKNKELLEPIKEILKSYGAKYSNELITNEINKYLKIDFTSDFDRCFMSGNGYLNISDIPGADENEFSKLILIYQSFYNKEIIDLNSEVPNTIKEFNDRGLRLVKSIISKIAPSLYIDFHKMCINDSGKWWKYEMFVDQDTEFGLFEFQIPYEETAFLINFRRKSKLWKNH